jgi:hypothetical protein
MAGDMGKAKEWAQKLIALHLELEDRGPDDNRACLFVSVALLLAAEVLQLEGREGTVTGRNES